MADLFANVPIVGKPNGNPFDAVPIVKQDTGRTAGRMVGQFAQGANDAIADVLGAPVDAATWLINNAPGSLLVNKGAEALGLGRPIPKIENPHFGSASLKNVIDYAATAPGRVVDAASQGSPSPLIESRTSRFDPENDNEKIARGVGSGVGNALTTLLPAGVVARAIPVGPGAPVATMPQRLAGMMATQPGTQLTAAAVGGGVTGATDNPYLGMAASLAVPLGAAGVRAAISPVRPNLSPEQTRLAGVARREGINLTPAQQTGSPTLEMMERTFNSMPVAAGPMRRTFAEQRGQFNSAVLDRAGVTANEASPDTIARAFRSAGQTFDDLASRTVVNADQQFAGDVQRVANDYGRRLPTDVARVFESYMDDLAPLVRAANTPGTNPQIAGQMYSRIRSDITTTMRERQADKPLQRALGGLVEALDDAMQRSTTGALRGEWQDARRQYQALMTVDRAMAGGTQSTRTNADIPFNALTQAVRSGDRAGFSRGRGQLNDLSRVGDMLANKVPDSGTPTRSMLMNPLMWPAVGVGGVASAAYNSAPGRAYLTNQLVGPADLGALYTGEATRRMSEEITGGRNALRSRQ